MEHTTVQCVIEHHATLYALISKHIYNHFGSEAKTVILEATTLYGNERGARMAASALKNGDDLSVINNQAYGEWKPDYVGQMEFGFIKGEPALQTYISKCAWCEAWQKHNLLDYGNFYCEVVDNAVFQGFNPLLTCTTLDTPLSWGGTRCEFDWEQSMSEEDFETLAQKKQDLGSSNMKNFNYHTAHLLHCLRFVIEKHYKEEGTAIINEAIQEYCTIFGSEYFEVLSQYDSEVF